MRLIFSVYTKKFYKDIHLPAIDNLDYDLILNRQDYGLKKDLKLKLEVVDGVWRFHKSSAYRVFCNGGFCEEKSLSDHMRLEIRSKSGDMLIIFVWQREEVLKGYKKYQVLSDKLVIGKGDNCAIVYKDIDVNSKHHAVIHYSEEMISVKDTSTNGTYLDGKRLTEESEAGFGSCISLYGLSVICLGQYIAIRCLKGDVTVDQKKLREVTELKLDEKIYLKSHTVSAEAMVHISLRNLPHLYEGEETIENVPQKKEEDKRPAWMSILPSLTMVLPMLLGYGLMSSGNMSMGLVISGGAAVVGVTWASINFRYNKKKNREEELRRLGRYEEYLVRRADEIREKFEFNRTMLCSLYPDAEICSGYTQDSPQLWSRKPDQSDFLFIRLGLGSMPFQVKIKVPSRGFSLLDDELSERPSGIARNYENMENVPLGISLRDYSVVGIITGNNPEYAKKRAKNIERLMLTQIAANHCYTDVKIVMLHDEETELDREEKCARWLPHIWSEDRTIRYFAENDSQASDVIFALSQIVKTRLERVGEKQQKQSFLPHYVIFVESMRFFENQPIVKYLYENGKYLGITTILLADIYENLPNACESVIQCDEEFEGMFAVKEGGDEHRKIAFDVLSAKQADKMARNMSFMRVNQVESSSDIPSSLTFFEMMGIYHPDQLNVLKQWKKNRTYESMQALIGQKAGGQNCYLDINEKYHGPHGLVAGTTGSGKSETLQTFILSLAINFSPQDVGLFIIDFKGGGMGNLFAGLPHTLGVISNLSGNQVRRAMVSITSEINRRQKIFGDYGINHIDGYTKLVKNMEASIPIPHLLIIIDEFAELKREEPEFMKKLVSVAQVGRSLGVHLILATQKPSGTVDDNIWSNAKFKLCLRVADKQDSNDMLHRPDAAYLTQAGRCYLQVGNDEIFELFQSGWSGAVYEEADDNCQIAAAMVDHLGRERNSKVKSEKKKKAVLSWMSQVVDCIQRVLKEKGMTAEELGKEDLEKIAKIVIAQLNEKEERYPENHSNIQKIESVIQSCSGRMDDKESVAVQIIEEFQMRGRKLPEVQEKTQLDAIVEYLAKVASSSGLENRQMLWMPVLPLQLALEDISDYRRFAFQNGSWVSRRNFHLVVYMGLVDDPENQIQFPMAVDFTEKGHLLVAGRVSSGKSTFLQTLVYGLVSTFSPAEVNIYAIDFSSQMLKAFEGDAHVGGVVLEGENDRLNRLFGMLKQNLQMRQELLQGGNFSQYIQVHGKVLPAIVLAIDGYARFREKTEDRFKENLMELSRDAEKYGIYLAISCINIGSSDLQSTIADNLNQKICLEMGDKYSYGFVLGKTHIDVLPEVNVKGRGLINGNGNILEYQTALACKADNDYARSEWIKEQCSIMNRSWSGECAASLPEIPEKPVWELFCKLKQYRELIDEKRYLPVAYYKESASVYGIDLMSGYRYLVLGWERTGKSVFMRNIACAAKEAGGRIFVIDTKKRDDEDTAKLVQAEYASEPLEIKEVIRELICQTNERGKRRKELQKEYDDENLYSVISREFQALYVLIMNFEEFLNTIYTPLEEDNGVMNAPIENIFKKARLLNVHFFAAASIERINNMEGYLAWKNFTAEKMGTVLGGKIGKQSVFDHQSVDFNERYKRQEIGTAYAVNSRDDSKLDKIVFPQNKGLVNE